MLHTLGAGLPHIISEMAIDIKGKSGGSVAEVGLHCLDVITSADAVDGICVAQVVDPQVGQADLPYRALKAVKYRPQATTFA